MTANNAATRKAKGRKLQQNVAERIRKLFELSELDVRSTSMGAQGVDIQLSNAATKVFPFAIECKCVEKVNLWEAWAQACSHAVDHNKSNELTVEPLLVIKKSHKKAIAVVDLDIFLSIFFIAQMSGMQ